MSCRVVVELQAKDLEALGSGRERLGAALMHVHSQEVINLVALAIRHRITASALRDSIFTHPSATEALNEVLGALH